MMETAQMVSKRVKIRRLQNQGFPEKKSVTRLLANTKTVNVNVYESNNFQDYLILLMTLILAMK